MREHTGKHIPIEDAAKLLQFLRDVLRETKEKCENQSEAITRLSSACASNVGAASERKKTNDTGSD